MRSKDAGFNLVELLIVMAVLTFVFAFGVSPVIQWWGALRVELAAAEAASAFQLARSYAVRHRAKVAVRFEIAEDGASWHSLYRDLDGDGVLNRDIEAGVDRRVRGPALLAKGGVRFGFPPGLMPRDPGSRRRLSRLEDPIRFNRSNLASFSPRGTATPGTVYITDGQHLAAARVSNRAGKVTVLFYDRFTETWH